LNIKRLFIKLTLLCLLLSGLYSCGIFQKSLNKKVISYIVDPKLQGIAFYWKNDSGQILKSIQNLKTFVESKQLKLEFAMNAGMYNIDNSPHGLYIQLGETLSPLDTSTGKGNFYMKPNGVFYITSTNIPVICTTPNFIDSGYIKFATQSGPMLLINGELHKAFNKGSSNLNIRNGVGILPDNRIVFAMSKKEINFYDFATYFKRLGCKDALYLDGLVSRMYLPEKNWVQTVGNFGVIIGVTKHIDK